MVTSSPLPKTRAAASGSIQMLNSADGVWLPSWIAPPMSTTRSIFAAASGCASRRRATFVSGPSATSVTARSEASIFAARKSFACSGTGSALGGGRSTPSSPVSPWASAATTSSPMRGPSAPAATGISVRPASSRTRSAFAVVLSSVWFPATAVTPRTSSSGLPSARRSASASSWPGSQSMRTGITRVRQSRSAKSRFSGFRSGSVP